MKFIEELNKRVLFADGGFGSLLQAKGEFDAPELVNLTNPQLVAEIHKSYVDCGCDIITANTFGANKIKCEADVTKIVASAIYNARKSAGDRFVAIDIGPTGKLLKPLGDLEFREAYEAFREVAVTAEENGADLAIIETMTDMYEMKAAVLAVKENTSLPIVASFSFDESGKLLTGGSIDAAVALLEGLNVDVIGMNCSVGPDKMLEFAEKMYSVSSTPMSIMPNAGLPKVLNGKTVYDVEPEEFAGKMKAISDLGVRIMGGCCGTTPDHIKAVINKCKNNKITEITDKNLTVISSYANAQYIGNEAVIIGERINPTGKKILRQALKDKNFEYIVSQGKLQEKAGASVLDVNVGMPEINENEAMLKAVSDLQATISLPLQIDSADPEVLENALRMYNGKALLNSVNGKEETMRKIFPIAKKYGAVVVGLTLDENGIPDNAEGRVKIAEKIINTAAEYGIKKKDIIIDALTLTVSADKNAANVTLEAVKQIKEKLGVKTVLGVSNVSFGLPQREVINSVFFAKALQAGLDAAIINPCSEAMMNVYFSDCALVGTGCDKYIEKFSDEVQTTIQSDGEADLKDDIINGLNEASYSKAKELLKTLNSQELVNKYIVPALEIVGKKYETGKIFLPQLLKSASAAQSAFKAIKESLKGEKTEEKGTIVVATVKGDIHDIGKNIAAVMLENYGYKVIDLGKDVAPELILEAVKKNDVRLVGLSALMTTTVPSMKETIKLIKNNVPDCKIMAGGAVITQELCEMINADFYSFDALEGVRIANKVFNN